MCGRTRCTLSAACVPLACAKLTKNGAPPKWDEDTRDKYAPSANVPPTRQTPLLTQSDDDIELSSMLWGFVPPWFHGADPTKHGLTTNNARMEGIETSKLYSGAMKAGRRAVVLCDGFYEWLTDKATKTKTPYLVYARQEHEFKEGIATAFTEATPDKYYSESSGWTGPTPLYMAAIYSETKHEGSEDTVRSYSVITRESNKVFSWLHHRVPLILATPESVHDWLNPALDSHEALTRIPEVQEGDLRWHPVSKDVGNVRNQELTLGKAIEIDEKTKEEVKPATKRSAGLMANWLKKAPKKEPSEETEEKKVKLEEEESAEERASEEELKSEVKKEEHED